MKYLLSLVLLVLTISAQAQTKHPLQLSGSFYSEVFLYEQAFTDESLYYFFNNNGGSLSAHYTLLSYNSKVSQAMGNAGSYKLQAVFTGGMYQVQNQSINTLFTAGLAFEKDFRFGLFLFANAQAGLLHSKFYVPVLALNEQGALVEKSIIDNYAIAPYSLGVGWNFNRQFGIPIGIKVNTFSFNKPYGFIDYTKNGLMVGIEWRFNSLKFPTVYSL